MDTASASLGVSTLVTIRSGRIAVSSTHLDVYKRQLCILNHNKLMADTDFEALVITGIGAELPYIGAAED